MSFLQPPARAASLAGHPQPGAPLYSQFWRQLMPFGQFVAATAAASSITLVISISWFMMLFCGFSFSEDSSDKLAVAFVDHPCVAPPFCVGTHYILQLVDDFSFFISSDFWNVPNWVATCTGGFSGRSSTAGFGAVLPVLKARNTFWPLRGCHCGCFQHYICYFNFFVHNCYSSVLASLKILATSSP
jgi:hypothetical protein